MIFFSLKERQLLEKREQNKNKPKNILQIKTKKSKLLRAIIFWGFENDIEKSNITIAIVKYELFDSVLKIILHFWCTNYFRRLYTVKEGLLLIEPSMP